MHNKLVANCDRDLPHYLNIWNHTNGEQNRIHRIHIAHTHTHTHAQQIHSKYCRWWCCWWNSWHKFLTLQLMKTKKNRDANREMKIFSQSKRLAEQVYTHLFPSDDLIKRLCHCIRLCIVDNWHSVQRGIYTLFLAVSIVSCIPFRFIRSTEIQSICPWFDQLNYFIYLYRVQKSFAYVCR